LPYIILGRVAENQGEVRNRVASQWRIGGQDRLSDSLQAGCEGGAVGPDQDPREAMLNAPHVRPLMDLVRDLCARGRLMPNVDPCDGGISARALFLLETAGPKAVGTQFISRDNPDASAKNMGASLEQAGFARSDVVLWNVVPYYVSTTELNQNVSKAQIVEAIPYTQSFIDELRALRVVVFCGRSAQRAQSLLKFPTSVSQLLTFHPGAKAFNHARCREHLQATFSEARLLISS
jgi:uracil-DNA glycosylase